MFFIGLNAYIPLSAPVGDDRLGLVELRPLGLISGIHNQGLVNGVSVEYQGTGVLYHNTSTIPLHFDPSHTYGRNNASAYGYAKIVFRPNIDGTYTVQQGWADSGTNTSTLDKTEVLMPGEYLWCPHTHETNASVFGGTWLIQPSSQTQGGVLIPGKTLTFISFKTQYSE